MKDSLNKNYNFVSKFVTLEDQEDSVNFDEIIAVAPPPIGINCSYNEERSGLKICKLDLGWCWRAVLEYFYVFLCFLSSVDC